MTINKAITMIQKELSNHPYHRSTPFYGACKLGIEALKLIKKERKTADFNPWGKLLGETEE